MEEGINNDCPCRRLVSLRRFFTSYKLDLMNDGSHASRINNIIYIVTRGVAVSPLNHTRYSIIAIQ